MAFHFKLMEVIGLPGGQMTIERMGLGEHDEPWPRDLLPGGDFDEGEITPNAGHLRWEVDVVEQVERVEYGFTDWDDDDVSLRRIHIQGLLE